MKTVKIVENKKDIERVINESIKYLEKHGIRIYGVLGECPALDYKIVQITNPSIYGPKNVLRQIEVYQQFNDVAQSVFKDDLKKRLGDNLFNNIFGGEE